MTRFQDLDEVESVDSEGNTINKNLKPSIDSYNNEINISRDNKENLPLP